jgi:threonine/homoserine/homoserine lactone efflux protein
VLENSSLYVAFIAASVALIAIPGPNVAVIVANSAAHGLRFGLMTVAGTSTAMLIQLALTVAGLSGILALAAQGFEVLRWIGVAYLVYLAIEAWRGPAATLSAEAGQGSARTMFVRGFLVSLTNPKTLFFYAAFLPQFVSSAGNRTSELAVLAATFLVLALVLDSCWAVMADRVRGRLKSGGLWLNRVTGCILGLAAVGLAVARRP